MTFFENKTILLSLQLKVLKNSNLELKETAESDFVTLLPQRISSRAHSC